MAAYTNQLLAIAVTFAVMACVLVTVMMSIDQTIGAYPYSETCRAMIEGCNDMPTGVVEVK